MCRVWYGLEEIYPKSSRNTEFASALAPKLRSCRYNYTKIIKNKILTNPKPFIPSYE